MADQPPAASASTSVPDGPAATVVFTPSAADGTAAMVPSGLITLAWATVPATCHRSYEVPLVTRTSPAAPSSSPARAWSTGAGSRM